MKQALKGSMVALVTPFKNGEVDYKKLEDLVEWHLGNRTDVLVPCGTTGESPTLTEEECFRIIKLVKERAKGKVPVVAGAGTNCTHKTIEKCKQAREAGADALLIVTPYYNKPTQEGLLRHFEAVARSTDLPIIVYNVPGRAAVNIAPETLARLAKVKNIVAVKEASGSIEQVSQTRTLCDIQIISGDDSLTFPIMALGGVGVISVAANIIPKELAKMCELMHKGEYGEAQKIHTRFYNLFKVLFIETSPVPVKTAMWMMGLLPSPEVRLPLCEMSKANAEKLRETLQGYGLVR